MPNLATDLAATGPIVPLPLPGASPATRATPISLTVNGGANGSLPGPAAGFVRYYTAPCVTPPVVGTAYTVVSFDVQPANLIFSAGFTSASASQILSNPPPLQNGESIRCVNGGVNPVLVTSAYWDEPIDSSYAFVRMSLTIAFQTVVPAPAIAGLRNKVWARVIGQPNPSVNLTLQGFNPDTVGHITEWAQGGALIGRNSNAGANVGINGINAPVQEDILTGAGALQARVIEAIVTTAPTMFVMYRTLPA